MEKQVGCTKKIKLMGGDEHFSYQLEKKITVIGDAFLADLCGVSTSVIVQQFGNISAWELRKKIRDKSVNLQYPLIIILVGGFQIMSHTVDQIVEGVKAVILAVRARVTGSWIGVSTLLYRPGDETMSKSKIDAVNAQLKQLVQEFANVGCKCVLIRSHSALVSPVDNKILRPIHVYFNDGFSTKQTSCVLVGAVLCCVCVGNFC